MHTYKVGIAEYVVSSDADVLTCLGLGSCVGVALHDPRVNVGGMAHIMLPYSSMARNRLQKVKPAKFADTAVAIILEDMFKAKAQKFRIIAKIAGGACMFSANGAKDSIFDVGRRNIAAVKEVLQNEGIKLKVEVTGGTEGRSVDFYTDSGKFVVKSKSGIKEL